MSHRHHDETTRCVSVGDDTCLQPVAMYDSTRVAGFIEAHEREWENDWRCEGFVSINPENPRHWDATGSLEGGDLTLSPSLLCTACGHHGFVQQGRWVPA